MRYTVALIVLLIAFSNTKCARIGSPSGGPKDSIAPIIAIAIPANKTTSFKDKKITISFDEYIKLEKLSTQLIISPPIEKKPIIKPQVGVSKKISIEFLEDLKPNTTYTINFGNSIVDNNEGNQLGMFSYVFSTGENLDSLSISGNVMDPLSRKDVENIAIMAYLNANDTIVGNYTPDYLSNSLKGSSYSLENLPEGAYSVIALEDKNNNYKYDKGFERIAFLDSVVNLKDTITLNDFVLFKEPKENKFYRPTQSKANQIIIGYQGDVVPEISAPELSKNNYFISKENAIDSLSIWYKNLPSDSLQINITQDTINKKFTLTPKKMELDSLLVTGNIKTILNPCDTLILKSNIPITTINRDSILLFEQDSTPVLFKIINQPITQQVIVDFERKPKINYTLILKELAFIDFFDKTTGEQSIKFKTLDIEEYGEIILNISNPRKLNLIVELTNKDNLIKFTQKIKTSKKLIFSELNPDKYFVRIIQDLNHNHKFDDGNFQMKIQPEPIYNLNKTITLRSNSEINENITIN